MIDKIIDKYKMNKLREECIYGRKYFNFGNIFSSH